jgi:archaeal chaperonin
MAVRRINESDMSKLSKATGARIITNIHELSKDDLGSADLVEERKVEADKWIFVEGCKNRNSLKSLGDFRVDRLVEDFKEGLSRQVQFRQPIQIYKGGNVAFNLSINFTEIV